mmetsp:Transcript_10471/g.20207  ORF Transcript_10471/g.20207 Transcript_10471/m.20207 type:complete len:90 (+) Transcript_10471:56-325(+)
MFSEEATLESLFSDSAGFCRREVCIRCSSTHDQRKGRLDKEKGYKTHAPTLTIPWMQWRCIQAGTHNDTNRYKTVDMHSSRRSVAFKPG